MDNRKQPPWFSVQFPTADPTAVGAVSSAIAVHVAGRRWLFSLGIMAHTSKIDRWLGFAALICAAVVFIACRTMTPDGLALIFVYCCFLPLGLFLALRGLFVRCLSCRIPAGVALIYFGLRLFHSYIHIQT